MQVRRELILGTMGNKTDQKAVVLLMLLKSRLGITSSLSNASINKIAACAGVSPTTIKRYIPIWTAMGLVEWRGHNNNVFVVRRMASSTRHRNIIVRSLDFTSFKGLYQSFRSFLFMIANSRKEFMKRLIRIANDPQKGEDYKSARKSCNHYARMEKGDNGYVYHEWGFSYKGIGKALGFCARTAEKIVDFAIKRQWCVKKRHFKATFIPNLIASYLDGFTFTTRNFGFVVSANTYANTPVYDMAIIDGKK